MRSCVHGNKGQDDGNKGDGDDAEHYGTRAETLLPGTNPVNP